MTFALARSLLLADAVTPAALAEALFLSATRGASLVRTLLAARAIDSLRLEQVLERGEAPYMRDIAPVASLVERLPPGLCDRLLAIPVRIDPRTGTVDVAVVDARDPHAAEEMAYWLKAPVRVVRTSTATMEAALVRIVACVDSELDLGMRALAPPIWAPAPAPAPSRRLRTPMYGVPEYDATMATLEPTAEDPDIAIPLRRRNSRGQPVLDLGLPAIEKTGPRGPAGRTDSDPVLDLKRRKAPSAPDALNSVLDRMRETQDRDQILDLLVAGTRTIARRAAVLAVRRDALVGWTGSLEVAIRQALRAVRLPNAMRTVFHEAFEHEGARPVRIPMDAAHAPLIAVMRSPPSGPVVVARVQADGKPVAVVFAEGIGDASAAIERVTTLARAAGEALGRILRERRSHSA